MRNRQPRMRHQIVQQVELRRSKVHRLATLANQSASRIKFDVPNSDYRVGIDMGCGRTSHRGPYACCQLADVEWLGDVVVRACIQRRHLVLLAVAHRQHEDPQVGQALAYLAARPDASDSRHVDVHEYGIDLLRLFILLIVGATMMPGQTCTVSPDTNGGPQYNQPPPFTENHFGSNIPIAWPRGYTVYYVEYSGNYTGYFSSFPLDYIAAITTAYSSWGDADNNSLLNYDYYGTTISGLNNARSNGNSTFQPWHEWIIVYQADLGAGVVGDTNSAWQNYGSNAVPIWAVGTAVSRVSNAMSLDFDDVSYSASTFAQDRKS